MRTFEPFAFRDSCDDGCFGTGPDPDLEFPVGGDRVIAPFQRIALRIAIEISSTRSTTEAIVRARRSPATPLRRTSIDTCREHPLERPAGRSPPLAAARSLTLRAHKTARPTGF
ncbi:hypothetical protein [Burkholderia oklahomensis]|uniref:hypothetical protein n=1 Tax=Burkholderia oklahomensis TaxID=342113 RepID=UPI00016A910B|nr:hypothetical protein [Burkholderia oklahomensis]AOI49220.1 hypothetical protein WI23_25870 [Burkholderia oklahomensis C6786]KUY60732.1 hypothetical protein WI23_13635 [Burkholderia oklahomensis C6786]MBI0362540.1 hypothetical protein [Burkholderia oklahomensis]